MSKEQELSSRVWKNRVDEAVKVIEKLEADLAEAKKENEEIRNSWHIDLNDKVAFAAQLAEAREALRKIAQIHHTDPDHTVTAVNIIAEQALAEGK